MWDMTVDKHVEMPTCNLVENGSQVAPTIWQQNDLPIGRNNERFDKNIQIM